MSPNFLTCAGGVLDSEGLYQCDPEDDGNWSGSKKGAGVLVGTCRGISAPVLVAWRRAPVAAADMRALTQEEALAIYEAKYWTPLHGDELPLPLAYVALDSEVMSGLGSRTGHVHRTVAWLQGALGVVVDDALGAITISAAQVADLSTVIPDFERRRLAFLKSLPQWPRYGAGWGARVQRVQAHALSLIQHLPEAN
ncbi:MAG TPA: glycosyl hydrolase 108 family protein [Nevskia sp.]|nr:glycosyl hydrolase 108 family protein [Nevskia sp.]